MFFKRDVVITIVTRCENGDNFKVYQLCESYKKPGTILSIVGDKDDIVNVVLTTDKSCVKNIKRDMNLLNSIGIKAEVKA